MKGLVTGQFHFAKHRSVVIGVLFGADVLFGALRLFVVE
jgi:hypothetical protein